MFENKNRSFGIHGGSLVEKDLFLHFYALQQAFFNMISYEKVYWNNPFHNIITRASFCNFYNFVLQHPTAS